MKKHSFEITKDLIAQHNLTDDEDEKIAEILKCEPNLIWGYDDSN
jgi:hypothetical protein